jgi:hypothetical protein
MLSFLLIFIQIKALTYSSEYINEHTLKLTFNFEIPHDDFIYKDYLHFQVNCPEINLSNQIASHQAVLAYDLTFKEMKKIYDKDFSINLLATIKKEDIQDAYMYITYYQHSNKKCITESFPLIFARTNDQSIHRHLVTQAIIEKIPKILFYPYRIHSNQYPQEMLFLYFSYITDILKLPITWLIINLCITLILVLISRIYAIAFNLVVLLYYILNLLLPWYVLLILIGCFNTISGFYIWYIASKKRRYFILNVLSLFLLVSSSIIFAKAYSAQYEYYKNK